MTKEQAIQIIQSALMSVRATVQEHQQIQAAFNLILKVEDKSESLP